MHPFQTTYDVLTEKLEVPPGRCWSIGCSLAGVIGVIGAILLALAVWYGADFTWSALLGLLLLQMAAAASLYLAMQKHAAERQKRGRAWLASGEFQITEGQVDSLETTVEGYKGSARKLVTIHVGGHEFREPDDLSYPLHGLEAGVDVRITHHAGEILRVERRTVRSAAPDRDGS